MSEQICITEVDFNLNPVHYTFNADGSLSVAKVGYIGTLIEEGTWERTEDRLRYTVVDGRGGARMAEHQIQWRGATLVLANETSRDECDAVCRAYIMAQVGGEPGTLEAYWQASEIRLLPRQGTM